MAGSQIAALAIVSLAFINTPYVTTSLQLQKTCWVCRSFSGLREQKSLLAPGTVKCANKDDQEQELRTEKKAKKKTGLLESMVRESYDICLIHF